MAKRYFGETECNSIITIGTGSSVSNPAVVSTAVELESYLTSSYNGIFLKYTGPTTTKYITDNIYRVYVAQGGTVVFNDPLVVGDSLSLFYCDTTTPPAIDTLVDWDAATGWDIERSFTYSNVTCTFRAKYIVSFGETDHLAICKMWDTTTPTNITYYMCMYNTSYTDNNITSGKGLIYVQTASTFFSRHDEVGWYSPSSGNSYSLDIEEGYTEAGIPITDIAPYIGSGVSINPDHVGTTYTVSAINSTLYSDIDVFKTPTNTKIKFGDVYNNIYINRSDSSIPESIINLSDLLLTYGQTSNVFPGYLLLYLEPETVGAECAYVIMDKICSSSNNTTGDILGAALILYSVYSSGDLEPHILWSSNDFMSGYSYFLNSQGVATPLGMASAGWNDTYVEDGGRITSILTGANIYYASLVCAVDALALFTTDTLETKKAKRYINIENVTGSINSDSQVYKSKIAYNSNGTSYTGTLVPGAPVEIAGTDISDVSDILAIADGTSFIVKDTTTSDLYRTSNTYEVGDVIPNIYIGNRYGTLSVASQDRIRTIVDGIEEYCEEHGYDKSYTSSLGNLNFYTYTKYLMAFDTSCSSDGASYGISYYKIRVPTSGSDTYFRYNTNTVMSQLGLQKYDDTANQSPRDALVTRAINVQKTWNTTASNTLTFGLKSGGSSNYSTAQGIYHAGTYSNTTWDQTLDGTGASVYAEFTEADGTAAKLIVIPSDTKGGISESPSIYIEYYANDIMRKRLEFIMTNQSLDSGSFTVTVNTYDTIGTLTDTVTTEYTNITSASDPINFVMDSEITFTTSYTDYGTSGIVLRVLCNINTTDRTVYSGFSVDFAGIDNSDEYFPGSVPYTAFNNIIISDPIISFVGSVPQSMWAGLWGKDNASDIHPDTEGYELRKLYNQTDMGEPITVESTEDLDTTSNYGKVFINGDGEIYYVHE